MAHRWCQTICILCVRILDFPEFFGFLSSTCPLSKSEKLSVLSKSLGCHGLLTSPWLPGLLVLFFTKNSNLRYVLCVLPRLSALKLVRKWTASIPRGTLTLGPVYVARFFVQRGDYDWCNGSSGRATA
jgi:hypothetical protein